MPSSLSRRSLAKGAAWALPTVAIASAAPAFAASTATPDYAIGLSYMSDYTSIYTNDCPNNGFGMGALSTVFYSNFENLTTGTTPPGFAVINRPDSLGNTSPTTSATIDHYVFTIAYPAYLIDTKQGNSGIIGATGDTTNWSLSMSYKTMTNPNTNITENMIVYTMTFNKPAYTQNTVNPATTGRTQAWAGTRLGLTFAPTTVANDRCMNPNNNWYATSIDASFTTANGQSDTLTGSQWKQMVR